MRENLVGEYETSWSACMSIWVDRYGRTDPGGPGFGVFELSKCSLKYEISKVIDFQLERLRVNLGVQIWADRSGWTRFWCIRIKQV